MDAAGNAIAIWTTRLPMPSGQEILQWASRAAGGDWTPGVDLGPGSTPLLTVSPTGDATATWRHEGLLRTARRPLGGALGPVEQIAPPEGFQPALLAVEPGGRSVAVGVQYRPGDPGRVLAASAGPGAPWGPPQDLSALVDPPVPPPPEPPTPAVAPVRMSGLALTHRDCRRPAARAAACRARAGAVVTFRLSQPARVRVTVQRAGRRAALRSITVAGRVGLNRLRIARPLARGAYVLRISAAAADGARAQRSLPLTVTGS
jgi:hypothetical protein